MATMTLCNTVLMLMLLAALSTCHGNAFGAWSGKQRQRKKKLAIYRSWPWISNCWEWDSNSGLSGIEPRALTTRPRRLGANLRRDATSRLLFLNQSVLADFDDRKKKKLPDLRLVAFQARVIICAKFEKKMINFLQKYSDGYIYNILHNTVKVWKMENTAR